MRGVFVYIPQFIGIFLQIEQLPVISLGIIFNQLVAICTHAAVRANVAFYPIDARGLVAEAPLGGVRPGFNLDKALQLSDALEDEGIARKLELRK